MINRDVLNCVVLLPVLCCVILCCGGMCWLYCTCCIELTLTVTATHKCCSPVCQIPESDRPKAGTHRTRWRIVWLCPWARRSTETRTPAVLVDQWWWCWVARAARWRWNTARGQRLAHRKWWCRLRVWLCWHPWWWGWVLPWSTEAEYGGARHLYHWF